MAPGACASCAIPRTASSRWPWAPWPRPSSPSATPSCSSCSASTCRSRSCWSATCCCRSCSPRCWRCRSTRSCAGCCCPSCPTPRAGAGAARTRPAACRRCPARSPPPMPPPLEERRPTMSPQPARRAAILGGFAFVLFAALFFRLWFLEVLSGEDYVSQAAQNRVRKIRIEAPRGDIVDRNGKTIVKTRQAAVVQVLPGQLPVAERNLAAAYGARVSASERARLPAGEQLRNFERRRRVRSAKLTAAQRRERRHLRRASKRARPVAVPAMPQDPNVRRLFRRLGRILGVSPRTIHRRVIQQVAQTPY